MGKEILKKTERHRTSEDRQGKKGDKSRHNDPIN